jgi:hypothetical protein
MNYKEILEMLRDEEGLEVDDFHTEGYVNDKWHLLEGNFEVGEAEFYLNQKHYKINNHDRMARSFQLRLKF